MGASGVSAAGPHHDHLPPTLAWPLGNFLQTQFSGLGRLTLNPASGMVGAQTTLASAIGSENVGNPG